MTAAAQPRVSARARILQVFKPMAVAWALVFVLAETIERLWRNLRIPEGTALHTFVEEAGTPLVVLAVCAIVAVGAYRRWPALLRAPVSVTAGALVIRLVTFALICAVGIAIVAGVAWYLLVLPREDPNHSQYGVSLFFAVMFYPAILAPAAAVLATWLWARRSTGGTAP